MVRLSVVLLNLQRWLVCYKRGPHCGPLYFSFCVFAAQVAYATNFFELIVKFSSRMLRLVEK